MYKALYRTWRPTTFEDVIGQEHITKSLKNQVSTGKIAHSYLFTGSRGIGKTTTAKVFAKAINCIDPQDGNPCNHCQNCIDFDNESLTDTVEMDAASNNGVDDIRILREEALYLPSRAKYRIYIIDEAHMLSKGAFNALLKIMEEPPSYVVFILATTEINKIPATILSRCQRFDFFRLSSENLVNVLLDIAKKENIDLTEEAAGVLSQIANGSARDAISLLDQMASLNEEITSDFISSQLGVADKKSIRKLVDYIIKDDYKEVILLIDELYNKSVDLKSVSKNLLSYFRNIMLVKEVGKEKKIISVSDIELDMLELQGENLSLSKIVHIVNTLVNVQKNLTSEIESKALFESAILRITKPSLDDSLSGILRRLEKIEETILFQNIKTDLQTENKTDIKNTIDETKKVISASQLELNIEKIQTENNNEKTSKQVVKISEEKNNLHEEAPFEVDDINSYINGNQNIEKWDPPPEYSPPFDLGEEYDRMKKPSHTTQKNEKEKEKNIETLQINHEKIKPIDTKLPEEVTLGEAENDLSEGVEILQVDGKMESWQDILAYLKKHNPPLEATLEGSTAYFKDEYVLIDAPNSVFFDLMRASNQTRESLRKAIELIEGKQYNLGPIKKGMHIEHQENSDVETIDAIKNQAEKLGIVVEIE